MAKKVRRLFIDINNNDPVVETKLVWLKVIVAIIAVAVVASWFYNLKTAVLTRTKNSTANQESLTERIGQVINQFASLPQKTKEAWPTDQTATSVNQSLLEIKNRVLGEIEINLNSAQWPEHSSDLMQLSFQYPPDWQKQETRDYILIAAPNNAGSQITISPKANPKQLAPKEWLAENNLPLPTIGVLENKTIDRQPTIWSNQSTEQQINHLIWTKFNDKIYQITAQGAAGDALLLDKILSNIKFSQ